MKVLGYSEGFHDAAVTVLEDSEILFASHSERFSRIKNEKHLCSKIINFTNSKFDIDQVAFYENRFKKRLRQLKSGQYKSAFKKRRKPFGEEVSFSHHLSHAAAAFQCSPFKQATALVIDAIGEFDTMSTWRCKYNSQGLAEYEKMDSLTYPRSLGLFYSAITDRVGLKPNEEEYILMGMAAFGKKDPELINDMKKLLGTNLHRGCKEFQKDASNEDLAKGAQYIVEACLRTLLTKFKGPIVYGGGVAHNVVANRLFIKPHYIFPNPGDAGSSLGAAALVTRKPVNLKHCFLGLSATNSFSYHKIKQIVDVLEQDGVVGVCSQRAEFGPRALGNRSLLADPRKPEIKDKVNEIKKRQKFRPFAPSVLSEYANEYFATNQHHNYDFMQYAIPCTRVDEIPSVVHVDNTSRVHTVSKETKDYSPLRDILYEWYQRTQCPILLNTSLNIKGEPIVNDEFDAKRFEKKYNTKVFT